MSVLTGVSTEFGEKFAAKLATAFESPIAIAACSQTGGTADYEIVEVVGGPAYSARSLRSELELLEFRCIDLGEKGFTNLTGSHRAIVAIDASEHRDRSLALLAFDPGISSALMGVLLEGIRNQIESELAKSQIDREIIADSEIELTESFIKQITQDFEELTWLRQSHRFADLYSVNASSIEVARTCIASLAEVIQAESLFFLETAASRNEKGTVQDRLHILAGPRLAVSAERLDRWIQRLTDQGRTSPILVDQRRDELELNQMPCIRNCMLTIIAKGDRIYGWLIAANKLESDVSRSHVSNLVDAGHTRFGTFEAGLMTTAANILSSQASNSELFLAQEELTKGLVLAIINAIDAKDCYTAGHSERVASFARCIAARIGLTKNDCEQIHMAGLLHDVGKIGIPDSILKKPGKLTDEEFDIIKSHPVIGHSILSHLSQIDYVLPGVLLHHEAFNGSGYPEGRKGEEIPPIARILAVSDAFDAMTSTRPYRTALSLQKATGILQSECNKTWDGELVRALLECIEDGEIVPGQVARPTKSDRENRYASLVDDRQGREP